MPAFSRKPLVILIAYALVGWFFCALLMGAGPPLLGRDWIPFSLVFALSWAAGAWESRRHAPRAPASTAG